MIRIVSAAPSCFFDSQLSRDLRDEFPEAQGFSPTNLKYMRSFYRFYSSDEIGHQVGGELRLPQILGTVPWRHHIEIMAKSNSIDEALFYIEQTIENGWSRAVLLNFIKTDYYRAKGSAPNNFSLTLPSVQSDLASEILKDPYQFGFLTLTEKFKEKELQNALVNNVTKFLLELGKGFTYYGENIYLTVDGHEYILDLLFYHVKLHCYVVIELKGGDFSPRDIGQLGFYISAVNHRLKTDQDNQTIGLLVCRSKSNVVAQYALENTNHPIGISEFELSDLIPEDFKSSLPTIEEIEDELKDIDVSEL